MFVNVNPEPESAQVHAPSRFGTVSSHQSHTVTCPTSRLQRLRSTCPTSLLQAHMRVTAMRMLLSQAITSAPPLRWMTGTKPSACLHAVAMRTQPSFVGAAVANAALG